MTTPKLTLNDLAKQILGNDDPSVTDQTFNKEWYESVNRVAQQNRMISAMIKIFGWLNGAVVGFVLLAWLGGFSGKQEIISAQVVMSLIGATIIQAGIAFITITKFLFPGKPGTSVVPGPQG
jgi:hypothetical protein